MPGSYGAAGTARPVPAACKLTVHLGGDSERARKGSCCRDRDAGTKTPAPPCPAGLTAIPPLSRGLEPIAKEPRAQVVLVSFPREKRRWDKSTWKKDIEEARGHRLPTATHPCSQSPSCLSQPSTCPRLQQSPDLHESCASTQSGSMAGTKHARTRRWAWHRTDYPLPSRQCRKVGRVASHPNPSAPSRVCPLRQADHSPGPRTKLGQGTRTRVLWVRLAEGPGTDTTHHTHARKSWHFLLTVGD